MLNCLMMIAADYATSHNTSPPTLSRRASRSLITPLLVLMILIPVHQAPLQFTTAAVETATRLADSLDRLDHSFAIGAVLQLQAKHSDWLASTSTSFQSQMKPSRFSTSAMPRLTRLVGISTNVRSTRTEFRIRVSMSAMGSVIIIQFPVVFFLPARLAHTRDQSTLACSRKQIRHRPNLRYTARGRPQNLQRCSWRVENFGLRSALAIFDLLATGGYLKLTVNETTSHLVSDQATLDHSQTQFNLAATKQLQSSSHPT